MEDNESMDEKDLAKEEKREFEEKVLEAIEGLKDGHTTISTEGLEVTKYGKQGIMRMRNITIAIIDKDGHFTYNKENFAKLKETLKEEGVTLEEIGLPNLENAIDQEEQEKKEQDEKQDKQDRSENTENEDEKENKDSEKEEKDDVEDQKDEIADELGVDAKKIYPIRKDSQFYENHLGMFPGKNLFFYEDKEGKICVGTLDEKGKPIRDDVNFTNSEVAQMRPIIRMGDGREDVKKEIPLQTIGINNPARGDGDKDVQDRYIAVFKDENGYLEFEEVEQPRKEGDQPISERIEIGGRDRNTEAANELSENSTSNLTPSEKVKNYEDVQKSSKGEDGVQLDEVVNGIDIKQIREDLTRTYGPMPEERLKNMTESVIKDLEDGIHYDTAIASVGIEERDEGGRTPGEPKDKRRE